MLIAVWKGHPHPLGHVHQLYLTFKSLWGSAMPCLFLQSDRKSLVLDIQQPNWSMPHFVHLWFLVKLLSWCPGMQCWCSRKWGWVPGSWARLTPGKLPFHFDHEASTVWAEPCSTAIALELLPLGRINCIICSTHWLTNDPGAQKIFIWGQLSLPKAFGKRAQTDRFHRLTEWAGEQEIDWKPSPLKTFVF